MTKGLPPEARSPALQCGEVHEKRTLKQIGWIGFCIAITELIVLMHEQVHSAIYKYFGIASELHMGFLWGEVVPTSWINPEIRGLLYFAHSLNEIVLPIVFVLLFMLFVKLYKAIVGGIDEANQNQNQRPDFHKNNENQ